MTRFTVSLMLVSAAWLAVSSGSAEAIQIDFSPPVNEALNLGSEIYPGDHALGLSPLNESNMPVSPATGDVIGAGIDYDLGTNTLTFDFAYGSAFGFVDLASDWNGGIHIHGAGVNTAQFPNANTDAGVIVNLAAFHTASGPRSGRTAGQVVLSDTHETWLLDNQLYVNIHTVDNGPGELRGQLVAVPEPGSLLLASFGALGLWQRRRRK